MSFVEFSLSPIEEVRPWGQEGDLSLSWYSLSEGRYRLKFGQDHVLNYSDAVVDHCRRLYPEDRSDSWVAYYVVRLWEDLINIFPHVLMPVPVELRGLARSNWDDSSAWYREVQAWVETEEQQEAVYALREWRDNHHLDTGYLSPGAGISFWNIDGKIEARWDSLGTKVDGLDAWSSMEGSFPMSVAEFKAAIELFDRLFLAEMQQRVVCICQEWNRPDVRVDLENLRDQQLDRQRWLERERNRAHKLSPEALSQAAELVLSAVEIPPA